MSLMQCPKCEATVEVSKAFCPDCGSPMDEEQKRVISSEYDSLIETEPVSQATQAKLKEHFKLLSSFARLQKDPSESNESGNEGKSAQLNAPPVTYVTPKQPDVAVPQLGSEFNHITDKDAPIDTTSKSDK